MPIRIDPDTIRRLLMHESRIHALPGRELRDLGDSILVRDPDDPEPFWNRLAAIRWPAAPDAFDRRLTEMLVLFATIARQPHIWPAPAHDGPPDLVARLTANGFRDMGAGLVMALSQRSVIPQEVEPEPGVTVERLAGLAEADASAVADAVVSVLADAFDIVGDREAGVRSETLMALRHPWFTHYLVRVDGRPAAIARRSTFDDVSYLSSIGTARWARGRGLGGLVTAAATRDAIESGSAWTYLGVFADNPTAIRLYERVGFEQVGEACPDLLLV